MNVSGNGNENSLDRRRTLHYILRNWAWNIGFNIVINFLFPFLSLNLPVWFPLLFKPFPRPLPAFGDPSLVLDSFWMAFYLGFFLSALVTQGTYEDVVVKKKVPIPKKSRKDIPVLKYFPRNTVLRAFVFTGINILIFLPIMLLIVWLNNIKSIPFIHFAILKGLYGGLMAMTIEPFVRYGALCDKHFTSGKIDVRLWPLAKMSFKEIFTISKKKDKP
jgi:hypothetical protein